MPGLPATAFVLSFTAYAAMAAAGVTWMDPGELAAAAYALGGAHPPGHPGYVLLGKLASLIPIGEVAFRLAVLSAACTAAAVAAVAALAEAIVPGEKVGAGAAAAVAAAAPAAIVNATRAEVYAPAAALAMWGLVFAVRFVRAEPDRRDGRHALGAALALSAAAAFHPLIAVAAALPAAVAVAARAGKRLVRLAPAAAGLALLAGFAYAELPLRALAPDRPLLVWGDPQTPGALFDQITGAAYRDNFSLAGFGERAAGRLHTAAEGFGLAALLAGLVGLGLGAATRLRGAGLALAVAATTIAAAATQAAFNPDMRGYVATAVFALSAGFAPLAGAAVRLAGRPSSATVRQAIAAAAALPAIGVAALVGIPTTADAGARRGDAPTRLWDATVAAMPPGPGVYFAAGDHSLFAYQYERIVAGGRPDIAVANPELCRDRWFLAHIDRLVPELHVPAIDDDARGSRAERLAITNMRRGRPVGGDLPNFGRLDGERARPHGRGYLYLLDSWFRQGRDPGPVPAPPKFAGEIGARVAGRVALTRAHYEAARVNLTGAARAAGLADFVSEHREALERDRPRPSLVPYLPPLTRSFVFAPWERALFRDDLAWRAGVSAPELAATATPERRLHRAWRAILENEAGPDPPAVRALGREAQLATATMLTELERPGQAEAQLRAIIGRRPSEVEAHLALGSLQLGPRDDPAAAERSFRRAAEIAPDRAEAYAGLGVALVRQGREEDARGAWLRARELAPGRRDVRAWLRQLDARGEGGEAGGDRGEAADGDADAGPAR